jgi:tripartite-type tricarboxylate transporter receptor subunit TctC
MQATTRLPRAFRSFSMTLNPERRRLVLGGAAIALAGRVRADTYPSHTIRMIVPFPAGGPTDIVARPVAQLMGEALGQTIFIDNRGGAGGSIGADAVAKAAPDGYTVLMGTVGTNAINTTLYKKLPYDAVADFTPIGTVAGAPVAVVAYPEAPFKTLHELVERARSAPNTIAYGSAGNGTPGHLAGAMFCAAAGIKLLHVPYKGSAPAVTDLLGGQIPLMFDPLQSVLTHIASAKLRALAVTSAQRAPVVPAAPTVAESGWKDFETTAWWAVYAPAKLPPEVSAKLVSTLQRIVESPGFAERLDKLGVQPMWKPLADFQKAEIAKWGAAVRATGLSLE